MSTWHVAPSTLAAYAQDRVEVSVAFSVEAHLEACDVCRHNVGRFVEAGRLDRMWNGVAAAIEVPQPGAIERGLMFLGVRDHVARLLAATPALRLSWMLAIAVVLAIAVAVAYAFEAGAALFLVIAPLLPVAGVAASFGPGVDPTYEIGIAAPMRSFGLLLIRTVAVVSTTLLLVGLAALLLPGLGWIAVAWLLPSLGLVAVAIAASTVMSPARAAAAVTVVWIAVATTAFFLAARPDMALRDVFGSTMQATSAYVLVASAAIVALRRGRFEKGEPR